MFPGQGSQYLGMGERLTQEHPSTKRWYDKASEILGYNLLDLCITGPREALDSTVCAANPVSWSD
jgi:[acyl-carrier-protein] S-malonyltransferase